MKNIVLLGELGKRYGRSFKLNVKTPAEAVRALCANFPDFEDFLSKSHNRNVAYRVLVGKQDIDVDELHDPIGKTQTIKIVPVIAGAGGGGGILKVIVGVALIAASFFIPGSTLAISAALATGISVTTMASAALYVGAMLVLSGTSQMLTPTPQSSINGTFSATGSSSSDAGMGGVVGSGSVQESNPNNQPSYVFNGAVNTTAQGQPVPLGYGRMTVGSAVISAGITVEEIPR